MSTPLHPMLEHIRLLSGLSVEEFEQRAADALNKTFASDRKWSDGGGTGLVQWTGDMGLGLDIDISKAKEIPDYGKS